MGMTETDRREGGAPSGEPREPKALSSVRMMSTALRAGGFVAIAAVHDGGGRFDYTDQTLKDAGLQFGQDAS
jgi:hypothetical protein